MQYKMRDSVKSIELSPAQRCEMQMVILENLIEFDRICRKHNIPYSIDGGTMLGAVRHKGFIPWDPDADIVIMRHDYEHFKDVCKSELDTDRFFLQDYLTDRHYRWGYARLLRNGTSYVRAGHEHIKARNGIFLDIFTMDSVPDDVVLRPLHCFLCYCIRKILWSEVGKAVHPALILRLWYKLLSLIPKNIVFSWRDGLAELCNRNGNAELIRHMCSPHPKRLPYGFPRILFNDLAEYEFEGNSFWGVKDFDYYLTSIYGDYMTLPPEPERESHIPCSSFILTENVKE